MRLTLRNLLAYMDDLLDPESARIIGQKTEESEFASGLLHRIRDVTRRVKLGSPEVIDRKAALDPNTVAEYLDNTLPADRVTDFEKACLDSDVELAEVAACHQILTLVLGEPAEVRPQSRVRMYQLPATAASHTYIESDKADAGENHRIDTPTLPPVRRRQTAVPEYLLEARRRRKRLLWIAAIAAVLGVAVYLGVSGPEGVFFDSGEESASPGDQLAMHTSPPQPQSSVPSSAPAEPLPAAEPVPSTPEATEKPSPDLPINSAPAPVNPDAPSPEAVVQEPTGQSSPVPDSVVPIKPVPVPPPAINAASEVPIPVTPLEPSDPPLAPSPDPGHLAGSSVPAGMPDDREPMIAEPLVPEVAEQGRELGRLITPDEMVLAADKTGHPFLRVASSEPLREGQRVVSLPTSRPVIRIDGKLNVEMVDGGEVHLLPSEENGPLGLEITSGRMIFTPTDEAGTVSVALRADGLAGLLSLADPTTLVALEVGRTKDPIQDPLTRPAPLTARLWAVSGKFSWTPEGAAETSLEGPIMIDLATGAASAPTPQDAPEWVKADLTGTIPRQASGMLNRAFQEYHKEADLVLRENADHRRREVRELARQSLSWIEYFDPVVEVLDSPERYVEWPELIELLRDSVRRGPRTAQAVRNAMGVKFGPRGEELYELLWKYDTEQLSSQSAKRLVQYLDDNDLPFRVLAFRNLNRITGLGYYYRPEESEFERRPSVQRWSAWAQRIPGGETPVAPEKAPEASVQ